MRWLAHKTCRHCHSHPNEPGLLKDDKMENEFCLTNNCPDYSNSVPANCPDHCPKVLKVEIIFVKVLDINASKFLISYVGAATVDMMHTCTCVHRKPCTNIFLRNIIWTIRKFSCYTVYMTTVPASSMKSCPDLALSPTAALRKW